MKKIRILIADDHSMVRQGFKQILELEEDMVVIAQASDGEEAIRLSKETKPDVILMDINMPGMNGMQAIKELSSEKYKYKIIVVTIHRIKHIFLKLSSLAQQDLCRRMQTPLCSLMQSEKYIMANHMCSRT